MRELLGDREGVKVVGDRFVFSSEVLFPPGAADCRTGQGGNRAGQGDLGDRGRDPAGASTGSSGWTATPTTCRSRSAQFTGNWELSQARALSVVRYMTDVLNFPPNRLSAAASASTADRPGRQPEARAKNRRIELKLTER